MSFVLLGILNSQATGGVTPAPAFLSSAPLWLDAADASTISESGGSVSQWDNKGTLENFSQATSADQPTTGANTLNGLNIIDFASDFLAGSTKSQWKFLHDGTTYFFATVMKAGNSASPGTLGVWGNNLGASAEVGSNFNFQSTDGFRFTTRRGVTGTAAIDFSDSGFLPANTAVVASALVNPDSGVAADRIDAFVNNTQSTVQNTDTDSVSSSDPSFNLSIGALAGTGANAPLTGFIAELIIVSGADATETNRQAVVNYLNTKWGVF